MTRTDLIRFLLFTAAGLAALLIGYLSRRRGWMDENQSRRVHFHTVTWLWSSAALISLWRLPLTWGNAWVVVIEAAVIIVPALLMIPLAMLVCDSRSKVGVMAVAAGVGNIGWTMGGYICFILIKPAGDALAIAGTAAAVLAIVIVLAMYPIAYHFGTLTGQMSLGRLMFRSLVMLPAMPLYFSVVGITLAANVAFPEWLIEYYIVDVVILGVTVGGYLGVGMRLRLGGGLEYLKEHALLAVFTFIVVPALTLGLIALAASTAAPMSITASRVMVVQALMPTGISCVILANVFHLDTRLAASIWMWNTLAFLLIVLPGLLVILGSMGWFVAPTTIAP